ncbi:MAG: redoxin domain-containing protein [Pyrinomonadaceae bacterium]|nr:redoxin domain-containing protein [Pyrinomonadaceae bacterium]
MFIVFGVAGVAKLFDVKGSQKAVENFGVPELLARPLGVLLPIIEIVTAILLLPLATAWLGAVLSFLLLAIFVGGIAYNLTLGRTPDCHCFGQIHSEPVGASTLIRNSILGLIALSIVVFGRESAGTSAFSWLETLSNGERMQLFFGAVITILLATAVYSLRQMLKNQTKLQRSIEILRLTSSEEGNEETRESLEPPMEGLPVGAVAPDFILPATNGKNVALEHLLMLSKPILMIYVSPTCNPCGALLPEVEAWQTNFGDKLTFAFLSSGSVKDNQNKFGAMEQTATILLQKTDEVATLFRAKWTPTALLINADGSIGSNLATGDAAIRELVEAIKPNLTSDESNVNSSPQNLYVAKTDASAKYKIGEIAPDFALPDLDGANIKLTDFRGGKTLLLFWSTSCGYCQRMIDDIQKYEKNAHTKLLFLSDNTAEANRAQNIASPILIQTEREVQKLYEVRGTPSAILIDEQGKIVSEVAVGAPDVLALVGEYKS